MFAQEFSLAKCVATKPGVVVGHLYFSKHLTTHMLCCVGRDRRVAAQIVVGASASNKEGAG